MDRGRIHEILYSTDSREELAERIVGLEDEAERLREYGAELLENLMPEICLTNYNCSAPDYDWRSCGDASCGNYTFVILAKELGIEVDE